MKAVIGAFLHVLFCCFFVQHAAGKVVETIRSRSSRPAYEAWTPPPEYASKTWGHKTMYLADVAFGTTGQSLRMLIDTGSWMVVVPGPRCDKDGCTGHRHFDVQNATAENTPASISFAHGSLAGHVFSDVVCAGSRRTSLQEVGFLQRSVGPDGDSSHMCARMSFLVADSESNDFADAPFDGILGLGLQGGSRPGLQQHGDRFSFLKEMVAQGSLPESVYTLRLGNEGKSELLFGKAEDTSLIGGQLQWVPLSPKADGHWQIVVSDLTLNGIKQDFAPMEVIVDSGTSLLAPDAELATWLQAHLAPKDCSDVNSLPKLGLRLPSGATLSLLPSDYIDRVDGKCQLALMPLSASVSAASNSQHTAPRLILGDSFLRRFTTSFDLGERRIGFGVPNGADMGKDLAQALFPDMSVDTLARSEDSVQTSAKLEADEDSLTAATGLMGHLSTARSTARSKREQTPPKSAAAVSDTPADAEEQAGYDYIVRKFLDPSSAAKTHAMYVARRREAAQAEKAKGHTTQDKLKAAGDNLDKMLAQLKKHPPAKIETKKTLATGHTSGIKSNKTQRVVTLKKKRSSTTEAGPGSLSWWHGVTAAAESDLHHLREAEAIAKKSKRANARSHDEKAATKRTKARQHFDEAAVGSINWWARAETASIRSELASDDAAGMPLTMPATSVVADPAVTDAPRGSRDLKPKQSASAAGAMKWWKQTAPSHLRGASTSTKAQTESPGAAGVLKWMKHTKASHIRGRVAASLKTESTAGALKWMKQTQPHLMRGTSKAITKSSKKEQSTRKVSTIKVPRKQSHAAQVKQRSIPSHGIGDSEELEADLMNAAEVDQEEADAEARLADSISKDASSVSL